MQFVKNLGVLCRMVRIEHSIFALPFAYVGAFLAAGGWPGLPLLFLLTVAMVGIRSFAMAFNRVADLPYDRKNPRTAHWPLVTGEITVWQTWRFAGVMAVLFVVSCAAMNPVCLALSPLALIMCAIYSYTKRLTWLCHFVLGAVIALAPIAGWLSVSPSFSVTFLLLAFGVLFWIAGFDILYSCQDMAFDSQKGLHSLPVRFGVQGAQTVSAFCHVNTVLFLFLAGLGQSLSFGWYFTLIISAAILWWQHSLISPDRPENVRFVFAMNGPISVLLFLGTLLGVLL
ncbi:putative 4-hydroxybenzoate polyprenyltransferase [Desulfovibrio sp. OttesenSCG-928-A18]|nr:putative 4-hydroxybenzoate polyprenyltransferase [Desulfovibrio sp. OttesenSCG-928-A18]